MSKTYWRADEALPKMRKYCAYQERCHTDVRYKLIEHGIYGDMLEDIMVSLITEGFLDEERFARSFARGKFRMNHWGKIRIKQELKSKQISDYCIKAGMTEISDTEYKDVLYKIIYSKSKNLNELNPAIKKKKLLTYAHSKGFEPALILEILDGFDF